MTDRWRQNRCAELKLRAERKAGQLLADTELGVNRFSGSTLRPLGVNKSQSSRWQRIAQLDDTDFETYRRRRQPNFTHPPAAGGGLPDGKTTSETAGSEDRGNHSGRRRWITTEGLGATSAATEVGLTKDQRHEFRQMAENSDVVEDVIAESDDNPA